LLLLALLVPAARAESEQRVVNVGRVEVRITDGSAAPRASAVGGWLARELDALMPPGRSYQLAVERRSMGVLVRVHGDTLVIHPRLPSASRDEQLQLLCMAAWILLREDGDPLEAWERARRLVEPLRPTGWSPRWWPRCCRGLDGLQPTVEGDELRAAVRSGRSEELPTLEDEAGEEPPGAYGRADLCGGFRLPLFQDWPWVVGSFGIWAPIESWELVGGLESMPLGMVEVRLGAGLARWRHTILRLGGGPLAAWNPGSTSSDGQRQPGLRHSSSVQAGLWMDAELGGWRGLARAVPGQELVLDGWIGWERRLRLTERWYLLPYTRWRAVTEDAEERLLSMGGAAGVRWLAVDEHLVYRAGTLRLETEHVVPTGRIPGPRWIRPRAVLFRAGADCGFSGDTGFIGGWAGAVGLALNPLREVKGVGWFTVATPTDFSSFTWSIWLTSWMPRP